MRTGGRLIHLGILVLAILSVVSVSKSQSPSSGTAWEYASVEGAIATGPTGRRIHAARICYATPQGCRSEEVTISGPANPEIFDSLMAATSKLGEQGWELTSVTDDEPGDFNDRVLYFRRQKSK